MQGCNKLDASEGPPREAPGSPDSSLAFPDLPATIGRSTRHDATWEGAFMRLIRSLVNWGWQWLRLQLAKAKRR